jgi:hypothetical protein
MEQKPKEQYMPKEPGELSHGEVAQDVYSLQERGQSRIKTLLAWTAPGRPFYQKNKEYYLNILVIMLLVEVILFLFSQYMLMVLVLAVVFLSFSLSYVPPHDFHYKITSEGLMVEDHFFIWEELYDFYFKRLQKQDVLIVRTKSFYPGELTLVLGQMHKNYVRDILAGFLPYREYVKPTFLEKAGDWLEKNFPLDRMTPHSS